MKKYKIEITETLQRTIEVEKDSILDALNEVELKYNNEEIVLDSSDFIEKEFKLLD